MLAIASIAGTNDPSRGPVSPETLCRAFLWHSLNRHALKVRMADTRPDVGPLGMTGKKDGRPFELVRKGGEREIATTGVARITPDNIADLFSHQYDQNDPNKFGCKGIFSDGIRLPTGNQPLVFFWKTGKGGKGIEFHHRDAVATLKRLEAEQAHRDQEALEQQLDYLNHLAQKSGIGELLPGLAKPFVEQARKQVEKKLAVAVAIENAARVYLADAERVTTDRKQESFEPTDLLAHSGYQLTAKKIGGHLKVVNLDIDSSVTSSQLSLLRSNPDWAKGRDGYESLETTLNDSIAAAHSAIAPELRAYRVIRVKRLSELQAAGIQLKAPPGYRLEELP